VGEDFIKPMEENDYNYQKEKGSGNRERKCHDAP
jgi:hypothetical protein